MTWPIVFFIVGLVFSLGFWLGQRLGFQEARHALGGEGSRALSDRELLHIESIAVEALQRAERVPTPGLTLSSPVRSRAKSA